jgi:hypothetical protein
MLLRRNGLWINDFVMSSLHGIKPKINFVWGQCGIL